MNVSTRNHFVDRFSAASDSEGAGKEVFLCIFNHSSHVFKIKYQKHNLVLTTQQTTRDNTEEMNENKAVLIKKNFVYLL